MLAHVAEQKMKSSFKSSLDQLVSFFMSHHTIFNCIVLMYSNVLESLFFRLRISFLNSSWRSVLR